MLTAGALTVMRSRMEWGSSRCGWRWVETWPIANCLVTCLRMRARSLSQCGEALRRRSRSTRSGGSGSSPERSEGGKGSVAEGGACWLLRLWAAYMDCRQMSNVHPDGGNIWWLMERRACWTSLSLLGKRGAVPWEISTWGVKRCLWCLFSEGTLKSVLIYLKEQVGRGGI